MQTNRMLIAPFFATCLLYSASILAQQDEPYRPQIHFSPKKGWMNDPNGMVYSNGTYHLFYQHYPDATVWGPMHWGHATSTDLIHWKEWPIALYPDSLGYIFSGSAVVDKKNTSGFGQDGKAPLVAIFTHHDTTSAKQKIERFQYQSLAYSNNDGKTWTKYEGNPVIDNPGIVDFRDPKVMWYEPQQKWIMTLATKDRITFYSSKNLKQWTRESEFGKEAGAHGGVWECPDLISFDLKGKKVWVLIVNINPGGPNKGSASQYFIGSFDGHRFQPTHTDTRWIDYGPDEYAGITWSNTGNRKIFLGWMSNWLYANVVPTEAFRSAMTVARDVSLKEVNGQYYMASVPVPELSAIRKSVLSKSNLTVTSTYDITATTGTINSPVELKLSSKLLNDFSVVFSNDDDEKLIAGYNKQTGQFYIDRTAAGQSSFHNEFASQNLAPRISQSNQTDMTLILDASSLELFADGGLTVMTALAFPTKPFTKIELKTGGKMQFESVGLSSLKPH